MAMKRLLLIFAILHATAVLFAQSPTISSLSVTGTNIKWYNAPTGGTQYTDPANTALVNGQTYYASQTINGVESTDRLAVTATVNTQAAPQAGTHTPSQTQIVWNWNTASGASGYKWGTTNVYADATDMTTATTKTETGLICETQYTRYVWAYNSTTGCISSAVTLTQSTSSCITAPTVTTNAATSVAATTVTLNGNITSINGASATTRGFKYSTTSGFNPATSGTNVSESGTFNTGSFIYNLSGLTSSTTYYVCAYATNSAGTNYGSQVSFTTSMQTDFAFTGAEQSFVVPSTGTYKLEVWGAQGGAAGGGYAGGSGGYSYGNISLTAGQTIYIYVGGAGKATSGGAAFNGGGAGTCCGAGGGGGTDIRVGGNALANRVIVGGGGGGGSRDVPSGPGGAGGGLLGGNGTTGTCTGLGGTQTSGYALGVGGSNLVDSAGGGGGYWGGQAGCDPSGGSGGGGSGYIGGVTSGATTAGQRSGDGFARITPVL